MVSAFVKVKNADFRWIKPTLLQTLDSIYRIRIGLDTVNRLELYLGAKRIWGHPEIKMIISSDEKRAGMVNISVQPVMGVYTTSKVPSFAIDAWETAAETLRFALAGENSKEKCWNCFEEKDFRSNFCQHCGKS